MILLDFNIILIFLLYVIIIVLGFVWCIASWIIRHPHGAVLLVCCRGGLNNSSDLFSSMIITIGKYLPLYNRIIYNNN